MHQIWKTHMVWPPSVFSWLMERPMLIWQSTRGLECFVNNSLCKMPRKVPWGSPGPDGLRIPPTNEWARISSQDNPACCYGSDDHGPHGVAVTSAGSSQCVFFLSFWHWSWNCSVRWYTCPTASGFNTATKTIRIIRLWVRRADFESVYVSEIWI